MRVRNRPRLLIGAGIALLLVGLGLFHLGAPSYTTEIEASASDEAAMSEQIERYSAAEIDAIPFGELSTSEKTAFQRARQSPEGRYSDRGASDNGQTFTYRNDVVNQYFVSYDGELYLLTVVTEIDPIAVAAGVCSAIAAVPLVVFGYRSS